MPLEQTRKGFRTEIGRLAWAPKYDVDVAHSAARDRRVGMSRMWPVLPGLAHTG